jgi:mycothiol synthase
MQTMTFRPARGAEDAPALIAVHDACEATDGVDRTSVIEYLPRVEGYAEGLTRSDPEDWVIAEMNGEVVGYGRANIWWAEGDGTHVYLALGWVKPEWRRRGIGTEILRRTEDRFRHLSAVHPHGGKAEFGGNASGTERDATAFLTKNGYRVGYTVLEMHFDGAAGRAPDLPLPVGIELRPALPEHYRAIWQCIGDAYYVHGSDGRFREHADEGDYRRYFHGPSADPSLWFVAWCGSRIAGQVLCRIEHGRGEVFEVSVAHGFRRQGLARALLTHGLRALQARGVPFVRLFTKAENPTRAYQLYESAGFRVLKQFPRWRKPFDPDGEDAR